MSNEKNLKAFSFVLLILSTLIWGSSFVVMKDALSDLPIYNLLYIRFLISAVCIAIVFRKRLKLFDRTYLSRGLIMGALLTAAYAFQTFGLKWTTPGKNAFLTAVYCVLVPFFYWAVSKTRPALKNILAAAICFVGIGFVSLSGDFTIAKGDGLTIICGIIFAVHIVCITVFVKKHDAMLLSIVQFGFAALFTFVLSCIFEQPAPLPQGGALVRLLYLAVVCTAVAMMGQTIAQKHLSPSSVAIVLSFEAVFGVICSVIFYHEILTPKAVSGFVLIFISVVVSEYTFPFLKRRAKFLDE